MWLDRFRSAWVPDAGNPPPTYWTDELLMQVDGYVDAMSVIGGASFNQGLYRFHSAESAPLGQRLAREMFAKFGETFRVFGYDWLGRQTAIDLKRRRRRQHLLVILDPADGDIFEVPHTFRGFLERQLVTGIDEAVNSGFFAEWQHSNPDFGGLAADECVGYLVPPFLGGRTAPENFAVTDFEVYWDLQAQLMTQL